MSQILNALRGQKAISPQRAPDRHDDAVLAGLGWGPQGSGGKKHRSRAWRIVAAALMLSLVALGAGEVWRRLGSSPAPAPPTVSPAATTPPPSPPQTSAVTEPSVPAPPAPATQGTAPRRAVQTAQRRAERAAGEQQRVEPQAAAPPNIAAPPVAVQPPQDHSRLATYYHRAGDFEKALLHYNALLDRDPLNTEAHNNLGMLFHEKRLYEDASREFRKALSVDPKYARARNNLGVALLAAGRTDEAIAEFRLLLDAQPRDVDALVNLALALSAAGQAGSAQDTLMRAIGIDPRSAPAHYNLARLYDDEREVAKALAHYRDFLRYVGAEHASLAADVRRRVDTLEARTGR